MSSLSIKHRKNKSNENKVCIVKHNQIDAIKQTTVSNQTLTREHREARHVRETAHPQGRFVGHAIRVQGSAWEGNNLYYGGEVCK
jgi:invasion protein IalB